MGTKTGARVVDFQEPRPPGGGPKYTHASKERRGRQKERRTKKERVRHVEKGTKGFEHASGQRPGEFSPKVSQSTKMSVSQPKRVVVYLCGGSGGPSRDLAFLFGP